MRIKHPSDMDERNAECWAYKCVKSEPDHIRPTNGGSDEYD